MLNEDQLSKIKVLRSGLRLQEPELEVDPAYKFSNEDLWDILIMVTPVYAPGKSPDDIPLSGFYYPFLLAKKEVYYRLATSTAPLYPLQAEGAKLEKNVRFDHYLKLVKQVEEEYKNAMQLLIDQDKMKDPTLGTVQSYEFTALTRYYSRRNYNLATAPDIKLTIKQVLSTSVELDWTKYAGKGLFHSYQIYVSEEELLDEYAEEQILAKEATYRTTDIHRLKTRISDLTPDTLYHVLAITEERNGLKGFYADMFKTAP